MRKILMVVGVVLAVGSVGKRKNLKTCQKRENDCLRTCPAAVAAEE